MDQIVKEYSGKVLEHVFPKDESGGFRWHAWQKCNLAIGRPPSLMMDNDEGDFVVRWDPPLTDEELKKVEEVFADSSKTCKSPDKLPGQKFIIVDLWDSTFLQDMSELLGSEVTAWFDKSDQKLKNTDLIEIQFSKELTQDEKAMFRKRVIGLMKGWK